MRTKPLIVRYNLLEKECRYKQMFFHHRIGFVLMMSLFFTGCEEPLPLSSSRERFFTLLSAILDRIETDYVVPLSEREIHEKALRGLLSGLDPFSFYVSEKEFHHFSGEFEGFGMELDLHANDAVILNVFDHTPAQEAGLQPFDRIVSINHEPVSLRTIQNLKNFSTLTLLIEREGYHIVTLKRRHIHVEPVTCTLDADSIAHIRILTFNQQTSKALEKILYKIQKEPLKGIVLDLRNNAGGLLEQAVEVCRFFIDAGVIVTVKYRDHTESYEGKGKDWMYGIPMIVLVNHYSASASEIVAGALKDHGRALIVGERTFGKGSVQSLIHLPGSGGIRLTIGYFFTPHGFAIHEKGINPNVITKDIKDIKKYLK